MANPIVNRLKKIFNISDKKINNQDDKVLFPGKKDKEKDQLRPIKASDELMELYNFWLKDAFEDSDSLQNRQERYSALSYAYYNNSIFSKAVNLYADEAIQSDADNGIISVSAKNRKVEKYIKEFITKLNLDSVTKLQDVAFNLTLYGDSFWVISIDYDRKTIDDVVPINVSEVKHRIEFNAADVNNRLSQVKKYNSYIQKDSRLQILYKMMTGAAEKKDYSSFFKSYLFGFSMGEKVTLPPWNVLHFRIFTTINEFAPYGRPIMINSLAPFRQLQAGKNLMALARAYSFPIRKYEVEVNENMDQSDIWEAVNEAREEFHNIASVQQSGKEQFSAGSEIWVPSGLISVESIESRMNLDDIADIEMLRDDLIMGTDIPKGYLIVDRGSFGTSGQALLKQHKPFARAIYKIQSSILSELTQLIRLQFAISGDFDYDEPFEITLPFPEIEESSDRIRIKNDLLRLAKDVVDNIKDVVGLDRDQAMPPEVIKDVFSQISFINDDDIKDWVDQTVETKNAAGDDEGDEFDGMFGSTYILPKNKLKEKLHNRLSSKIINECYYEAKHNGSTNLLEHSTNGKHFYSSFKIESFQDKLLKVISSERKKLEEEENSKD